MLNLDFSNLSDEEIEKMTQGLNEEVKELEARLKKKPIFNNPIIDKFTKIDDLLRQNIALQKDLIEQVYISNKLALATYYKDGGTSVAPKDPYSVDTSILERLKVSSDDYKTLVKNFENMKVSGSEKIFEIEGSGIVAEIKFQSSNATATNKVYGVRIMSDNSIVYQDTWSKFEGRNAYETDMTCYEDLISGFYILAFKNMAFAKSLIIEVYGSAGLTISFSNIYLKYHLKVV